MLMREVETMGRMEMKINTIGANKREYLLTRIAVTVSVTAHFSAIIVTTGLQNSAIIYMCHTYCRIFQF